MANENKKDFNAMLWKETDMPKIQIIVDDAMIKRYGGAKMLLAPPLAYDELMKKVPTGKVTTSEKIRDFFARENGADFTCPLTAGIFISIVAWASDQRTENETPYWRTLKTNGELNPKYPGGIEVQKKRLEAEGHTIIHKGRTNIKYFVQDYQHALYGLE